MACVATAFAGSRTGIGTTHMEVAIESSNLKVFVAIAVYEIFVSWKSLRIYSAWFLVFAAGWASTIVVFVSGGGAKPVSFNSLMLGHYD
jgi:hypothetical protein